MKKSNSFLSRLLIGLVFLFLYAPIFILIIFSFNSGNSSAVWQGFSTKWYASLFQNRLIMTSVYTTLLVSLLATVIATVFGTFAAIGLYALDRKKRDVIMTVNNIPMMNADIVTGVSLCLFFVAFFNGWSGIATWLNSTFGWSLPTWLTLGFPTLLIAHVAFNIPYVILNVGPKLRQMNQNLVDAAMDLGCTWMQAFWKVILPEIMPGIASGAMIAFTMSVDDFIISYFTAGSSTQTLAMTIYGMTKRRITPEINAISTLLFTVVLVLLVISNIAQARQEKKQSYERRRSKFAEWFMAWMATPAGKWARRIAVTAACVLFVVVVSGLAAEVNAQPVVNVCSLGEYIDEDLIGEFEELTGIHVNYQTAESNEAMYSLLKSGGADYDVITTSDYMLAQLIEEGMVEELDFSLIPNYELIDERFKGLSFDPENKYVVPYTWGTLGLIYDANKVEEEVDSWSWYFDEAYSGQVLLIGNSRDAFGIALKYLGYSMNTTDEAEIREAFDLIQSAIKRGVYQGKVSDEVFQKMEGGNAAIASYYAGDYLSMVDNESEDVDLQYVIPKEGSNWFVDGMCVLKSARHKENAEIWINYLASTECNLRNMDYIWYASPNTEALEQYPAYYEELYEEELDEETFEIIAAPYEVLDRCEMYYILPAKTRTLYNDLWTRLGI